MSFQYRLQRPRLIFLLLGAFATVPPISAVESGVQAPAAYTDPLTVLARSLVQAGNAERLDFAWIAVSEVVAAYEKQLERSRHHTPSKPEARRKLRRWQAATRSFIGELQGLRSLLDTVGDIYVEARSMGPVIVFAAGKPVILSGPEVGAVRLMERRIVDSYCAIYDCSGIFEKPEQPAASKPDAVIPAGRWSFDIRRKAAFETDDGLVFVFSSLADRARKQRICEAIVAELRRLAEGLAEARRAGHRIDWESLEIQPLAGQTANRLVLNRQGHYLLLGLPHLEKTRLLDKMALPWLQAQLKHEPSQITLYRAERFMYDLPQNPEK